MKKVKLHYLLLSVLTLATAIGCEDDDKSFEIAPSLGFATTEGIVTETNSVNIGFYSNVRLSEPVTATVTINNFQGLVYGVDYFTEPEVVNNTITVTIDPENEDPYFQVFTLAKGENRQIGFSLTQVSGSGLSLAQQTACTYTLRIKEKVVGGGVTITHNFNDCTTDFGVPSGFIEALEPGSKEDRGWGCRAFGVGPSRAPRASAFGGTAGDDKAWLIMNPVAVAAGATVTISFATYSQHPGLGAVSVKWSSNYSGVGNPLVATWTTLSTLDSQFPAAGSKAWTNVSGSFTNISGANVYLAFAFTGGSSTESASYDIDDLTVVIE